MCPWLHAHIHTYTVAMKMQAFLVLLYLQREINYLYPVCACVPLFVLFVLVRFRFSLSFETPMPSQTGVCFCTEQVGFATVCVWSSQFLSLCQASMGHLCVWVCLCKSTAVPGFIRMLDMSFGVAQDAGHCWVAVCACVHVCMHIWSAFACCPFSVLMCM